MLSLPLLALRLSPSLVRLVPRLLLVIAHLLPGSNSRLPPPGRAFPLLFEQLLEPLGRVEDATGAGAAGGAGRVAAVPLQRAGLAEVVAAARHDGLPVGAFADDAGEWNLFEQGGLLVGVVVVGGRLGAVGACDDGAAEVLLALCDVFPLAVELPAGEVALALVEVFAIVCG